MIEDVPWLWLSKRYGLFYQMQSKFAYSDDTYVFGLSGTFFLKNWRRKLHSIYREKMMNKMC